MPCIKARIPRVVSKSDKDHGTATAATEPLGTPAGITCRRNLSLGLHLENFLLHILYVYHHPQLNPISPLELAIKIAILIVNQTRNKIVVTTMYYL